MDSRKATWIDRRETLYDKPKSLARELIQKLFLKILSKLFPQKFLSYKNKIKFIMNRSAYYMYFYIAVIYLRFKYPFYFKLPSRHIYILHTLIKFLKILEKEKIEFFLTGGTLLGAVRQESFADVRDIDLGIREDQFPKLLNAIPLLVKNGVKNIKKNFSDKSKRLHILFPCALIDISVYKKKMTGQNALWIGEEDDFKSNYNGFTLPINDLENLIIVKAYGRKFLSPANPDIYLEKAYGKDWKTPKQRSKTNKKYFFWYKK